MRNSVDQGWAWVVMCAAIGCTFIMGGLVYTTGLITLALLETFGGDLSSISWLGSLYAALNSAAGPISGWIINRTSCRFGVMLGGLIATIGFCASFFIKTVKWLFLTYSFMGGIGVGIAYLPFTVILGYYFKQKLSLASGFAASGASIGTILLAPLINISLKTYGLQGTFLLLGALTFHLCLFGSLLIPSKLELESKVNGKRSTQDDTEKSMFVKSWKDRCCKCPHICKMPSFLQLCLSIFLWSFSSGVVYLHLPAYIVHKGSTDKQAALALSVLGGMNIVSRILTGLMANTENMDKTVLYMGSFGVTAVGTLFLPLYSDTYPGQLFYAALFGLNTGGVYALINPINVSFVGVRYLADAYGYELLMCGLGYLIGPPLAGLIIDRTKSYDTCFIITGCIFLASSLTGAMTAVSCNVAVIETICPEEDEPAIKAAQNTVIYIAENDKAGPENQTKI